MNRRMRRIAHDVADRLESAAEVLRRKAQRPARPRPLVFPSKLWLMMDEMLTRCAQRMALQVYEDLMRPVRQPSTAELITDLRAYSYKREDQS